MGIEKILSENACSVAYAYGFSWRKFLILKKYARNIKIRPISKIQNLPANALVFVWGGAKICVTPEQRIKVVRVEDGFLRSAGLGVDLVRPLSWSFDDVGIYFDSTRPSRLEQMIQTIHLTEPQLERAKALLASISALGVTKYNTHSKNTWQRPINQKSVVLVIGQVETDASVRLGSPIIQSNLALIQAVRQKHPQAYIVYKPHPDVEAGVRQGGEDAAHAQYYDEKIVDVSLLEVIKCVDEVHVLTSLAGFEALIRGKQVHCYGQPFFAGWGLTLDMYPVNRRQPTKTIEELIYSALIEYPDYYSFQQEQLMTVEKAIETLSKMQISKNQNNFWKILVRGFYRLKANLKM
mgnify:CR=1 FL=1